MWQMWTFLVSDSFKLQLFEEMISDKTPTLLTDPLAGVWAR